MKLTRKNRGFRLVAAAPLVSLVLGAVAAGQSSLARATLWTLIEVALSMAVASAMAIIAVSAYRPRMQPILAQAASRGIELVAALPLVVVGALLAVATRTPVPIVIGIVIGVLTGLRCLRTIAVAPLEPFREDGPLRLRVGRRLLSAKRLVIRAGHSLVEDVVGIEAAITWLGLLEEPTLGGLGERIGIAAGLGQLGPLLGWTGLAVSLAVAVKLVAWASLVEPAC